MGKLKQQSVKDGLYKRGKSWYIRCMINGTLYRKSIGPDRNSAEAVLEEMKKQRAVHRVTGDMAGLDNLFKTRERKTFTAMADAYIAERPHLKPNTLRGYQEIFNNYLKPVFGNMYLDQITEEKIAQIQAEISQKVSATRTNNIMGPLRYVMKISVRRKLIADNPCLNVPPLREEDPRIDPLNVDELERALAALKPYQRPLFICLAWTGARPDELFALRWKDIRFASNEIHIDKGRVRGKEGTPKTKSSARVIHMFSPVRSALIDLENRTTQHLDGYFF
jgi:integrase